MAGVRITLLLTQHKGECSVAEPAGEKPFMSMAYADFLAAKLSQLSAFTVNVDILSDDCPLVPAVGALLHEREVQVIFRAITNTLRRSPMPAT
jgi:hypothetical protein